MKRPGASYEVPGLFFRVMDALDNAASDKVCDPFTDHNGGQVDVDRRYRRKDASICNDKPFGTTNSAVLIQSSHRIALGTHRNGATWVVTTVTVSSDPLVEFSLILKDTTHRCNWNRKLPHRFGLSQLIGSGKAIHR